MSTAYQAVGWNRQKRVYDLVLLGLVLLSAAAFGAVIALRHPDTTAETFIIRFTSLTAFALLHVTLAIGPLARLYPAFMPLLYNRRHLGVTVAVLAMTHGVFSIIQFHAFGDVNPVVSVFTAYDKEYLAVFEDFRSISRFPFELFGFGALLILCLMAATSHDFWLKNLGPAVWKRLHQLVYLAYGLLLAHVLLGVVQSERSLLFPIVCGAGCLVLVAVHLLAAQKELRTDKLRHAAMADGYVEVAATDELSADTGKVVVANGVRYALFVRKGRLFALSNVCRHQGGPIGEGRILNGCITCPWHGYQYRAEDGCSPPPFSEVLETYPLRLVEGKVFLSPVALPLETKSEGVPVENVKPKPTTDFPIGWQSKLPAKTNRLMKATVTALALVVPMAVGFCAWFFNQVDRGRFEFGNEKTQRGILYEQPVPRLRITSSDGVTVDHILVGAGKFGAGDLIKGAAGREVSFTGTRIERKPFRMIEITRPETFRILNPHVEPLPAPAVSTLGEGEFTGELVDTKCWSGVMRPATGKVHRACAIRCLSGGVPPGLLVRDKSSDGVVLLLASETGGKLEYDVQLAARFITVKGILELHGETPVLRVASIKTVD
jgi:DMSO/TMAO reductase YedYZ heme-binding membrane subunit/nitrite reductase/ring-hydroxylating ferredoxin subunit